ncbi:MAG: RcnB family protein [Sphingomonas sp.]
MRILVLAAAGIAALTTAGPAMAQHAAAPGAHWSGNGGGQWHAGATGAQWRGGSGQWHGGTAAHGTQHGQWQWSGGQWRWHGGGARHDWGGRVGGRWIGGTRAPGGWSGYHRPVRGWALPGYWLAPSFYVTDWGAYGLGAPPYGYHWSRYYDDAVLVDQYGRVMDWSGDVDWDGGYQDGYSDRSDYDYDYSHDVGPGAGYPPPPPPRSSVEVHRYGGEGPPPTVVVHQGPDCGCDMAATGGYYYPSATTTTVTVTSVPVTTRTTTTTYIEEQAPPVVHRHHVVRVWHRAPAPKRHRASKLLRRR